MKRWNRNKLVITWAFVPNLFNPIRYHLIFIQSLWIVFKQNNTGMSTLVTLSVVEQLTFLVLCIKQWPSQPKYILLFYIYFLWHIICNLFYIIFEIISSFITLQTLKGFNKTKKILDDKARSYSFSLAKK